MFYFYYYLSLSIQTLLTYSIIQSCTSYINNIHGRIFMVEDNNYSSFYLPFVFMHISYPVVDQKTFLVILCLLSPFSSLFLVIRFLLCLYIVITKKNPFLPFQNVLFYINENGFLFLLELNWYFVKLKY